MEIPREQHLAEVRSCGKLETFVRCEGGDAEYSHEAHMIEVKDGDWGPFHVSGEAVHMLVEAVGWIEAWNIIRNETTSAGSRLQFSESTVQLLDKVRGSAENPDA